MTHRGEGIALWAAAAGLLLCATCDSDEEFVAEPDDLGQVCAFHSDCIEVCTVSPLHSMAPHCTRSCSVVPCPAGYVCVAREQLGQVCAIGPCQGDGDCPESYRCETDHNVCQHVGTPCGSDADCPAGVACNQGVCQGVCSSDDDCKQGYYCSSHVDACVFCVTHAHCTGGFACIGGACGAGCVDASDCRPGYECIGAACAPIAGGGPGDVGTPCAEHTECIDFCHHTDYCTRPCDVANEPGQCPDGYYCEQFSMLCIQGG